MSRQSESQTNIPLGNDVYLTLNTRKGESTIKIMRCKVVQSLIIPNQSVVIPTRVGIEINRKQFEQLLHNAPLIFSLMDKTHHSSSVCEPLTGERLVEVGNEEFSTMSTSQSSFGYLEPETFQGDPNLQQENLRMGQLERRFIDENQIPRSRPCKPFEVLEYSTDPNIKY